MRNLRQIGHLVFAILVCALTLAVGLALITVVDNWVLRGNFTSFLFVDLISDPWPAIGFAPLFTIAGTCILLSISTLPQMLVRQESLWGHVLLGGFAPFLILLFPGRDLEEPVVQLSIAGLATGACWWFIRRRQKVRSEKYDRPPKMLWVLLALS